MNPNKGAFIEMLYLSLKKYLDQFPKYLEPYIRRFIRFLALPYCFFFQINWDECTVTRTQVIKDLCYIFFCLKYYPDNYSACRLYEKERSSWHYYYGSNYDPYQRAILRKIQPKEYEILFEDKEVCMQLCKGLKLPLPKTLGVVDPQGDYRNDLKKMIDRNHQRDLILKPVRGAAGRGIVKIFNDNGSITVKFRNKVEPLEKYVLDERSLVQDVVTQDESISIISDTSVNTIRVLTLLTKSDNVLILGSTMRFGVGSSFIDNWSAGGIAVGVNVLEGTLKSIAYDKLGNRYKKHPVTNIVFDGFIIKKWNEIKRLAEKSQKYFPYYRLLGLDIAITTDGPVIIEINAFPDFVFQEQTSGPLLAEKDNLIEFKNYDLLFNQYQKRLYS